MPSKTSYNLHKKKYTQISVKKRMLLVKLVVQEGKTLSEAGRKLQINPSTVRLIINKYKETGTYFMKRLRNTPKQSKSDDEESESDQNEVKLEGDGSQEKVKVQQEEGQLKKEEEQSKVKVEQPKATYLENYYPFLHYGCGFQFD